MPHFIVTYDLRRTDPSPYAAFKDIALKRQWYDFTYDSRNDSVVSLPNTTLSLECATMREAVASFAAVVDQAAREIPNFHREKVTIIGAGEICGFADGEPIRY